ncbi:MAG: hypothetical protein HUJ84_01540 [Veillonella sp.]|nr:hypothetical protein [Veillonella sp.]
MKFKQFQFLKQEALRKLREMDGTGTPVSVPQSIEETLQEDALTLAYIGDAVYSLYIRERVTAMGITKVQVLHTIVTGFINAKAQAQALLLLEEHLDENERLMLRRGRNANVNVPKSASVQEYRSSTAFEALLGYWHVTGQRERLQEAMQRAYSYTLAHIKL